VQIICLAGNIYFVVLLARILFSWFPPSAPESPLATLRSVSVNLTEPVLAPVRRMMPPTGMIDFSTLIVMIGLQIVMGALGCSVGL
jgi:YggT family protein